MQLSSPTSIPIPTTILQAEAYELNYKNANESWKMLLVLLPMLESSVEVVAPTIGQFAAYKQYYSDQVIRLIASPVFLSGMLKSQNGFFGNVSDDTKWFEWDAFTALYLPSARNHMKTEFADKFPTMFKINGDGIHNFRRQWYKLTGSGS